MRTISAGFRDEIESPNGQDVIVILATITHPSLDGPICVNSDVTDYVFGGNTFFGVGFTISFISDDDDPPQAKVAIENVDRSIGEALLSISDAPQIGLQLVKKSDFDNFNPRNPLNAGLQFNGSTDAIRFPFALLPPSGSNPSAATFGGWFKTTAGGVIWAATNAVSDPNSASSYENVLYVGTGGKLQGGWYDGTIESVISAAAVNDGNWHFGVLTFTASGVVELDVDNVSQGTQAIGTPEAPSNVNYWLANGKGTGWPNLNSGDNWFTGALKDMRVYDRVLSSAEKTTWFNGGDITSGLVGRYRLSWDATDASGSGNDGTILGAPTPVGPAPTVEYTAPLMFLRNVQWDAQSITADLLSYDLTTEPWPAVRTTPSDTPALFR